MAKEIDNIKDSGTIKNGKIRVVIYGNNWVDRASEVCKWAEGWFNEHELAGRYEAHICKTRGAIEDAFYGKAEGTDPETLPDLVMAGKYIRDNMGGGWFDFELDDGDITRIQSLCEEHNVPLVRFRFNSATNSPQLISGIMMSREKAS